MTVAANSASNSRYRRAERAAGRAPHPAMVPQAVADFCVKLTTDVDDVVYDPFMGAGTTAVTCEALGRRWIGSERARDFVTSSRINFTSQGVAIRDVATALVLDQGRR